MQINKMWNTALLLPRWYAHVIVTAALFWPKQKLSQSLLYLKNPLNMVMATSLIWPDICGLFMTGSTGFHCVCWTPF